MKRLLPFILGAALLAFALPHASGFSAPIPERLGPPSFLRIPVLFTHSDYPNQRQGQPSEIKTFTGRISKNGQKFVLEDSSMRTSYQLDDQQQAGKYQGKNVRVIGTLDAESNIIHVQSIEEAV